MSRAEPRRVAFRQYLATRTKAITPNRLMVKNWKCDGCGNPRPTHLTLLTENDALCDDRDAVRRRQENDDGRKEMSTDKHDDAVKLTKSHAHSEARNGEKGAVGALSRLGQAISQLRAGTDPGTAYLVRHREKRRRRV